MFFERKRKKNSTDLPPSASHLGSFPESLQSLLGDSKETPNSGYGLLFPLELFTATKKSFPRRASFTASATATSSSAVAATASPATATVASPAAAAAVASPLATPPFSAPAASVPAAAAASEPASAASPPPPSASFPVSLLLLLRAVRLLGRLGQRLVRDAKVFDRVASQVGLGEAREFRAVTGRADRLSQVHVHPRVAPGEDAVVGLSVLELDHLLF